MTFADDASNPVYNIIKDFELLLYNGGNNWQQRAVYAQKLLTELGKIFTSAAAGEMFVYFLELKAATAWSIQCDTGMPEATVYRCMKRLRALGIIEPCQKVRGQRTAGGPRPKVWAVPGASKQNIADAINKHRNLSNPLYRVAMGVVQQVLLTGKKEVTLNQLRSKCPSRRFKAFEVAEAAVPLLHAAGVKVWR